MPKPTIKRRSRERNIPVILCACKNVFPTHHKDTGERNEICPVCTSPASSGQRFDSKLECKVYQDLCLEYGAGNIVRQVSMPLPEGDRIRPDFMVILGRSVIEFDNRCGHVATGSFCSLEIIFVDAKGRETQAWKSKAKRFEKAYGIEIQLRRK